MIFQGSEGGVAFLMVAWCLLNQSSELDDWTRKECSATED
jgi:hypothetical protein